MVSYFLSVLFHLEFRPAGRVSFWAAKKKPKNRQEVSSGWALCAHICPPYPSGLRPSPLDKGVGPLDPHFTGARIRQTWRLSQRRGWLSRLLFLVFRCRSLGRRRRHSTPLAESAFVCGGAQVRLRGRRIQEPLYFFSQGPMRASGRSQAARCAAPTTSET